MAINGKVNKHENQLNYHRIFRIRSLCLSVQHIIFHLILFIREENLFCMFNWFNKHQNAINEKIFDDPPSIFAYYIFLKNVSSAIHFCLTISFFSICPYSSLGIFHNGNVWQLHSIQSTGHSWLTQSVQHTLYFFFHTKFVLIKLTINDYLRWIVCYFVTTSLTFLANLI